MSWIWNRDGQGKVERTEPVHVDEHGTTSITVPHMAIQLLTTKTLSPPAQEL
jgi:hypothetical protein